MSATRHAALALTAVFLLAPPAAAEEQPTPRLGSLVLGPAPATLDIRHADELGPAYLVESVVWSLGAQQVGEKVDGFEEKPARRRVPQEGASTSVTVGEDRMLRVDAVLRGQGTGSFSYLNKYTITITGGCQLDLAPGDTTAVDVVLVRSGGPFADFGEGLAVECRAR